MSLSIKPCQKFNIIKTQLDTENAVTYMSLRKSGCPSKSAMHFCKKMLCRNDSTKIKDGPTNFRILKLRKESELQINGWNLMDPKYDLGEFHQTYKELVKEDPQEKLLQRHFIQSEDKGREDFRRKITNLTKYYHDLNTEYNFSALPRMKLFQKLKDNKQKSNDEKQKKKHYYLINDTKFYTLGEEAHNENSLKKTKSLISQMKLFSSNEMQKTDPHLFEESSEEEELCDTFDEEIINSKLMNTFSRKKKKNESQIIPRRLGKVLNVDIYEAMKKKSTIFYNLEAQTNFLNKITNMENVVDNTHMDHSELRLLKVPTRKPIIDDSSNSINNQRVLNFDSKKFAEEEFNKSKYLTFSKIKSQKRATILSSEVRNKLTRSSLLKGRGSNFMSNLDISEFNEDQNFNETLNKMILRNIDFWQDFMKKKKDVDKSRLNEIIEKRKNLKLRYLGKILCEEEKNNNKGCYVNWTENCSRSTTIPPSKIQSKYQNN